VVVVLLCLAVAVLVGFAQERHWLLLLELITRLPLAAGERAQGQQQTQLKR
jgi:hypothetical protein